MTWLIIIAFMAWWTIAYPLTHRVAEEYEGWKDAVVFVAAILWPITVVLMVPWLIINAFLSSSKTLRIRLRNRGLMRDFEKWLVETGRSEQDGSAK